MDFKILLNVLLCTGLWICATTIGCSQSFEKFDENMMERHLDPLFTFNMSGKIQVYLNEGINSLNEASYLKSISNLDSAIALDKNLWMGFYYRGVANASINKMEAADKDFQQCISLNPKSVEALLELGKLYTKQNAKRKAVKIFEQAAAIRPDMAQPFFWLGVIDLSEGKERSGSNLLKKCLQMNSKFAPAYMLLALRAKNRGAMLEQLNKAIAAEHGYASAYFLKGLIFLEDKKLKEALIDLSQAIRLSPGNVKILTYRMIANSGLGRYDDVIRDVRRYKNIIEQSFGPGASIDDFYFGGSDILNRSIGIQFAADYISNAKYAMPVAVFDFLKKGFCEIVFSKDEEGIATIRNATRILPTPSGYYLSALAFDHLRLYDSAFNNYDKALRMDNDIFDAHKKRGYYRSVINDAKGAFQDLNEMRRLRPSSFMLSRLSGEIKYSLKDYYGAIIDLTRYLKVDSTNVEVLEFRAQARSNVGDYSGSNGDYQNILRFDSTRNVFFAISDNFFALKDTVSAIKTLREYASLNLTMSGRLILATDALRTQDWKFVGSQLDSVRKILSRPEFKYSAANSWASFYLIQGMMNFCQKDYQEAINSFDKSLKNWKITEAIYVRAKAQLALGNHAKAKNDFEQAALENYKDSKEQAAAISVP